ncbi:MAG: efflux RND transporter periplasmic adaptor subunit, partial [Candidatus Sumerlaeota bacterium]
ADVLSEDALRLKVGDPVELDAAGREGPLTGSVKRIEPMGFTKRSSLGVEQQRVNIIFSLDESPDGLGVGYRLQARFITHSKQDALLVSRFSVLQDTDGSYYVLKIADGALQRQNVEVGLSSDLKMEITQGLTAEDLIVETPDTTMEEGMEVTAVNAD